VSEEPRPTNKCRCCQAGIPAKSDPAFGFKRRVERRLCTACSHLSCMSIRRRTGRPHSQCPGNTRARMPERTFEPLQEQARAVA
jgi:hypothetical protein